MDSKQLQQIAERCKQGDQEAFALLYTAMRQPLRAVCLGYVHDEAVADDLLHDAFLLIFYQIGQLRDTASAEPWMTRLTQRVALSFLRQQKRQPLTPCYTAPLPQSATVSNRAESSLAVAEILAAVDALPEGYRKVFRLFVLEGMTHKEIAKLLHIDPHSSSSQLFHAKALLRRWLRPMVLLLLAVALPLGLWLWQPTKPEEPGLAQKGPETPEAQPAHNAQPAPPAHKAQPAHNAHPAHQPHPAHSPHQPHQPHPAVNPLAPVAEASRRDSLPTPSDTLSATPKPRHGGGHLAETPAPPARPLHVPTAEKGGDWLLAVTYSGMSGSRDLRLPYANAETNPAVYDSVAHHRRPLTLGLMVNRRLGTHWQVGAGLSYERMTSNMRSGNTYVTLSQHQMVQYLSLPLSLSWHYPLGRHFSTYAAASVSVGLPLRSTLESVYILNGQAYEPTTERLHPSVQWSAGLGLGLQLDLTPHVGLFAEPGLRWHFGGGSDEVKTWHTEHPLDFTLPLGLRITF